MTRNSHQALEREAIPAAAARLESLRAPSTSKSIIKLGTHLRKLAALAFCWIRSRVSLRRYIAVGRVRSRILSLRTIKRHIEFMAEPAFDYRHLSIDERLRLVEDIWDSIAEEANVRADALPLSPAQRAELERRVADADAHPDEGIPWEQVRNELLQRGG